MQQISCGFARISPDLGLPECATIPIANPRMDALLGLIDQLPDRKVVIWCRFQHDVESVVRALRTRPGSVCWIYGPMPQESRDISKNRFINDPAYKYLVATPDSAGRGLDGLQKGCSHAIYYSNSFNAIARWQSEDRIHRIGQHATASYFDLIARGSPDRAILRNLRDKKSLSELVLGDMRKIIEGVE
jgi:SNF2 family DNA or RNA helicase